MTSLALLVHYKGDHFSICLEMLLRVYILLLQNRYSNKVEMNMIFSCSEFVLE